MKEDWAGLLWQRFKDCYGQKWTSLFQGSESIESWRVTWSGIDVSAEQIRHALSRIGREFPEWPPTYGQFKALCEDIPRPALPAPKVVRVPPSAARLAELTAATARSKKMATKYWTPEVVVNHDQVNFIVLQADRFGTLSMAGQFMQQCIDAGVITSERRLATQTTRRCSSTGSG